MALSSGMKVIPKVQWSGFSDGLSLSSAQAQITNLSSWSFTYIGHTGWSEGCYIYTILWGRKEVATTK